MMRIGQGVDVHAFTEGDHIIMGGVRIAHSRSIAAHSDGDVLIHAVCDALLGAAAMGDIGAWFPSEDDAIKGMDSRDMLRDIDKVLREKQFTIQHIDSTIVAQAPKIAPHIMAMRECLAGDLQLELSQVSVKATTTDGLGYIGRGEGVAVHAVALLDLTK